MMVGCVVVVVVPLVIVLVIFLDKRKKEGVTCSKYSEHKTS